MALHLSIFIKIVRLGWQSKLIKSNCMENYLVTFEHLIDSPCLASLSSVCGDTFESLLNNMGRECHVRSSNSFDDHGLTLKISNQLAYCLGKHSESKPALKLYVCAVKCELSNVRCVCLKTAKSNKKKNIKQRQCVQLKSLNECFTLQVYKENTTSAIPFNKPSDWDEAIFVKFVDLLTNMCVCLRIERDSIDNFNKMNSTSFKNGQISNIKGGKQSLMRNRVLGCKSRAFRFTISIDSTLPPGNISLPIKFQENFQSCTPLVMLSRAPNLLDTNVAIVSVLFHSNIHDR